MITMLPFVVQHLSSHSGLCGHYLQTAASLTSLVNVNRLLSFAASLPLPPNSQAAASGSTCKHSSRYSTSSLGPLKSVKLGPVFSSSSTSFAKVQHESRRHCRWLGESKQGSLSQTSLTTTSPQPAEFVKSDEEVRLDTRVTFDSCWRRFEEKYRLQSVHVPREVVWLNGAPGAGKGANTQHILKTRGLDHSICISTLLASHGDTSCMMERGELIPDTVVGDLLLEALLVQSCNMPECGVLVDGFPRTAMQVDFLKLLWDKLGELHVMFSDSPFRNQFPRPFFKVVMLYVDEETSIQRQLERAKMASVHNKRVLDAGAGKLWEQRATDLSIEKCKKRYEIFRRHHSAILRLKQFFAFHLIDSMGTVAETQEAITTELRYQSSLDLSYETYASIRHLPLARDVTQYARQQLVMRLDNHSEKYPDLFQKVIDVITSDILPLIHECGLSGRAEYVSEHRMFLEHPRAAQMIIDVLTDRGYHVSHSSETTHVPVQIDLTTGFIKNRKEVKHKFYISWDTQGVRELAKAMEIAAGMAEGSRISQSFIPTHINREQRIPLRQTVDTSKDDVEQDAIFGS